VEEPEKGGEVSKPKTVLIEEYQLGLRVPRGLPEAECSSVKRLLDDAAFEAGLRQAVRSFLKQYAVLDKVRVILSR
jgi:hypothetical protein